MEFHPLQFILGLLLGVAVAYLSWRAHALSRDGAFAAAILGTVVFGLGGFPYALLLLGFFISSTLLSHTFTRYKAAFNEKFSKGAERDAAQVAANGSVACLFAIMSSFFPGQAWPWWGFAASLAAVNADTWATELGVLNRTRPRLISSLKPVEPGSSGAVSWLGTAAALLGAGFIGLLAWLYPPQNVNSGSTLALTSALAGFLGSMVDSWLGATVQAVYTCPSCQKETERHPLHLCGTRTILKRGLPWLNNDWVNLTCATAGAITALAVLFVVPAWAGDSVDLSGGVQMTLNISSSAFSSGGTIPKVYTCDGQNRSPDLTWSGLPEGTRSLALILDDPDAPGGTFTHWVLYNMPASLTALSAGQLKTTAINGIGVQGTNDFSRAGYDGPCPPRGNPHRYIFHLYALDVELNLKPGSTAAALRKAISGHVLAVGEYLGKYNR